MGTSTERMEEVGRTFAGLWEDHHDLASVRPLYAEDAVFISPNPPAMSPEFGTKLEGRDEILRYFEACLPLVPPGAMTTLAILTSVEMAVWVYEAGETVMADVLLFDGDGLIKTHRVTAM